QRVRGLCVVQERELLVCAHHGLDSVARIDSQLFCSVKEEAGGDQGKNDSRGPKGQEKFSTLSVHQHYAANGGKEIDQRENYVAPVRLNIGKTALQQNVCVVSEDGVDAGGLVAGQDHARQNERNHVLPSQKRFLDPFAGRALGFFRRGDLFHLPQFRLRLFGCPRTQKGVQGRFFLAALEQPARRLRHQEAADHKQHARRKRDPKD